MVTFGPIDQLGWASACFGVTLAMSARLHERNGPPEAVRQMHSMLSGAPPAMTCIAAECSESTGSSAVRYLATSRMKIGPAETRHSLLASAVQVPWRTAASVGLRPAAPTIAAITQSAGRLAASTNAS